MAKISTYPIISLPTFNDLLIGTDVNNLNETKNFTIGDIADLIIVGNYVPYVGATTNVDLGIHSITASSFIVPGGLSTEFVKADGSLDSTVYQPAGNYITGLSGEATASGPGVSAVVLDNGAVIGKVLTGLTITGGSISSSDSILQAFGKLQNQVNGLYGGAIYQGTWNALTNTPTLTSSVGTQGYYYIVSVAGNTVLDGISDWNVGDWAIFDGTAWQQVDNTDTVVSVNGQVGIVVLTTTDIAEGTNLYYTDTRARAALTLTTTGSSGASTYNNLTGAFNIPNYTLSGLGGVPSTRQLSINGTAYDLSADRSWSVGTVTSIGTSGPLTGGTITGSGTIGITQSGIASDGYLSSVDWNTFNNKQNALVNPVTGTGTVYYIPLWTGVSALGDSIISYSSNVVNYNYNSASGATVNYINTNGTAYTYTIQMNNVGTRQTYHSYTDGNIIQRINSNDVSRNLQSGQLVLPYYTALSSFTGTAVGFLGFDSSGNIISTTALTSVGLSMPAAFSVANTPLTSNGTIAVTGAGTASQYIRGDGQLATLPTGAGGGSSVNYYLNGSVNQGTIGGSVYYEMNRTPVIGTGTDFTRTNLQGDGLIAQFITDANDPNRLEIPAGSWNFEMYFNVSSAGGTPAFYLELLKYDGTTFTSIANGSTNPETITGGTAVDLYLSSLAVPQTTLLATDRLAIRVYVITSGRNITLHTEDNNLCEIITTFAGGVASLNGLTANTQYFATGTSGTDFAISSATDTHTFNLPTASATNRGALSSADWSTFSGKVGGSGASGQVAYWNGTSSQTGSNNLFWDAANSRLGIGTNTPVGIVDIVGTLVTSRYLINGLSLIGTNTTASAQTVLTLSTGVGNQTGPNIILSKSRGQSNDVIADGDFIGTIQFQGGNGSASVESSRIQSIARGTFSTTSRPSSLSFFTTSSGSTTVTERMRIFETGNIALQNGGTFTDSGQRLQVQGTSFFSDTLSVTSNTSTSYALNIIGRTTAGNASTINFFNNAASTRYGFVYVDSSTFEIGSITGSNIPLIFSTNQSERMRITSGGNLLVGTTVDNGSKFQVSGAATFSSSVTATDLIGVDTLNITANNVNTNGTVLTLNSRGTVGVMAFQTASTERMRITSGGNVGIGITSPARALHVLSGVGTAQIQSSGTTSHMYFGDVNSSVIDNQGIGSVGNNLWFSAGGLERLRITSGGHVNIGGSYTQTTDIFQVTGSSRLNTGTNKNIIIKDASHNTLSSLTSAITFSRTDGVSDLAALFGWNNGGIALAGREGIVFATGGSSLYSATSEAMRLTSGGNLGIGTTSPSVSLHIEKVSQDNILAVIGQSGYEGALFLSGAGSGKDANIVVGNGRNLEFHTSASATPVVDGTERMRLTAAGNLLVGTTADQGYRVQITGSGDNMLNVWGATAPSIRLDNAASGATQRFVLGLATATNNFIQGASAGDVCITTATASPMVFGMWQTSTASEVMRITTSNNLLINKTTDGGQKLQVIGKVNFASLPTSSAGLSAGDIWNNGGVLNIV